MFIKVTRSAAVSALSAGLMVRLDATGEILQLGCPCLSKRACRRMLSRFACWFDGDKIVQTTFSVYQD